MKLSELRLKRSGTPLKEPECVAIEKQLGVDLPPDYCGFLQKYNGGDPEAAFFRLPAEEDDEEDDDDEPHIVVYFCQANEDGVTPVKGKLETLSGSRYLYQFEYLVVSKEWLVIGRDDTDNLLLLGVAKKNLGKIGFSFVGEDFGKDGKLQEVIVLAKDFTSFIKQCTDEE